MIIGNIITNTKINVSNNFNVVDSLDGIIKGIPTLIIGFKLADKYFPNFNPTNFNIKVDYYWTTNKTENRDKLNIELEHFKLLCYNEIIDKTYYIYVDIIHYSINNLIKIYKKIINSENKTILIKNNMYYINIDNIIFGVDFKIAKFYGLNSDKLKNKLLGKSSVFIDFNDIFIEYEEMLENLNINIKFISVLHSIKNGKNKYFSNYNQK